MTAAAALGVTKSDIDTFIRRLDKVFAKKRSAADQTAAAVAAVSINGSQVEDCVVESAVSHGQVVKQLDDAPAADVTDALSV